MTTSGGYLYEALGEHLETEIGEQYFPRGLLTSGGDKNANSTDRMSHMTVSRPIDSVHVPPCGVNSYIGPGIPHYHLCCSASSRLEMLESLASQTSG